LKVLLIEAGLSCPAALQTEIGHWHVQLAVQEPNPLSIRLCRNASELDPQRVNTGGNVIAPVPLFVRFHSNFLTD